ncbi:MarR family transcriptional regulator [candidate division KSB1 bacterium]|nr:MarR family transcriptional regulator [candidate division KSB1 bacterium]
MKIEQEIKQKEFHSEYHKLLINIFFTNNRLLEKTVEQLKPYQLTPKQYNVLRILRGQYPNPATVKLIRDRMLDKMSDASRIVERLRVKGLIRREICDDNRRAVDVQITEKGLNLLKELDEQAIKWEQALKTLTVEEATQLNFLLDKLRG